jgi:hypothetical protein
MGLLLEWRGDYAAAEPYFDQIRGQYGEAGPLLGFYFRRKEAGTPGFASKFDALAGRALPGLQKLDRAKLPKMPQSGVRVADATANARAFGLEDGDVIVGLDGWRIQRKADYTLVRDFDWRPEVSVCAWRKGQYFDVVGRGMNRRLGFVYTTYPREEGMPTVR